MTEPTINTTCPATVTPEEARHLVAEVTAQARGRYQEALLAGRESWSGSTLRGIAREYGFRYAVSRHALTDRIAYILPGSCCRLVTCDDRRMRRMLVIGCPPNHSGLGAEPTLVTWEALVAQAARAMDDEDVYIPNGC